MSATIVLNQVLTLFIIMGVGFFARKKGIITTQMNKKLSELLLNIVSPCLIVVSFQFEFSDKILINGLIVLAYAILIHFFSIFIASFVYKKIKFDSAEKNKILKFGTVFTNCGFMGFPLLESLHGKIGILYGSIYVAVFYVFIWTYGVMLFNSRQKGGGGINWGGIKKILINPGLISVLIGIILFIFSIKLPFSIINALENVGLMNTPLAMLIIGATLTDVDLKSIVGSVEIYWGSIIKLIVVPIVAYAALRIAGVNGTILGVCTLIASMPTAANTTIFAEMFESDSLYASRLIGISTLLSIFTIPAIIMLTQ